jgi:hypothetical protein
VKLSPGNRFLSQFSRRSERSIIFPLIAYLLEV